MRPDLVSEMMGELPLNFSVHAHDLLVLGNNPGLHDRRTLRRPNRRFRADGTPLKKRQQTVGGQILSQEANHMHLGAQSGHVDRHIARSAGHLGLARDLHDGDRRLR